MNKLLHSRRFSLLLSAVWLAGGLAACSAPTTEETTPKLPEEPKAEEAKPAEPPKAEEPKPEPKPEEKPAEAVKPAEEPTAAAAKEEKPKEAAEVPEHPADIRMANSPAEVLIAEGVGFLGENNLADAQQRLINATKQDPKSATAWYNLALCQFRLGSDEDALAAAKKAIEINPTFNRAVVLLSVMYQRKGQASLAIQAVDEALKGRPTDVMLLGAKARALVANGDFTVALDTCVTALRLDHGNPEAMRYMAEAYLGLGRVGLAKLALDRAFQVYTGDAEGAKADPSGKGQKQYELRLAQGGGSWRGAGAEALVREAGLAHIYYLYGRLAMKDAMEGTLEDWQTARDQFKKAVDLRPDYAEAWNNLGLALTVARKGDEAVIALTKALDLQPQMIEARINLGSALRVSKDPERADKARLAYEAALKQDPKRPEIHFNLGILYLENKLADVATDEARYQKSLEYFNAYKELKGSTLDPKDPLEKYIADAKLFLSQEQTKRINAEKAAKESEEDKKKRAEEEAKKKAEAEARAAEEEAKKKAAEEAARKAEEEKAKETPPTPAPPPEGGTTPAPAPEPAPTPAPEPAPAPAPEPAPAPAPTPAPEPTPPPPSPDPAPPPPPPDSPTEPPPPPPPP